MTAKEDSKQNSNRPRCRHCNDTQYVVVYAEGKGVFAKCVCPKEDKQMMLIQDISARKAPY